VAHQCAVGRHAPSPQLRYVLPIIIKNHGPHLGCISEHIRGRAVNRDERELGSRIVHIAWSPELRAILHSLTFVPTLVFHWTEQTSWCGDHRTIVPRHHSQPHTRLKGFQLDGRVDITAGCWVTKVLIMKVIGYIHVLRYLDKAMQTIVDAAPW